MPDALDAFMGTPPTKKGPAAPDALDDYLGNAKAAKAAAAPPTAPRARGVAPASLLEQVGGALDLPFILNSADNRGDVGAGLRAYLKNPALANREYGFMAKPQLDYEKAHPDVGLLSQIAPGINAAGAAFFERHPKLAGATTFAAEFANPVNRVVGPALGAANKLAKAVPGVAEAERAIGSALSKPFDLFHDVRQVGGTEGEARSREMLARITDFQNAAREHTKDVFGGLTPAQQRLVVHVYQDPKLVRNVPPEIAKRATKLDEVFSTLDRTQKQMGLLEPNRTFGASKAGAPKRYFPMRGAYTDPDYNEDELDILGGLRAAGNAGKGGGAQVVRGTSGAAGGSKSFDTLREAEASGKLADDFLPARQLLGHLSQRYGNVATEYGLRNLPPALRQDTHFVSGLGGEVKPNAFRPTRADVLRHVEENNAQFPPGHPYRLEPQRPAGEHFYGDEVLAKVGSPTLRDSTVNPAVVKLLQRTAARVPDSEKTGFLKTLDTFNRFARIGIISNPAVHVGWNLTFNYLAAGGDWDGVANAWMKTARALGQAASGKAVTASEQRAPLIAEAQFSHGTPMFGSDEARLLTIPAKNLKAGERVDKTATDLWQKNQAVVFDVAEREFANSLYEKLVAKGATPDAAAIGVRKALGDYANADPTSTANRALIFYPWLKTVVPFWTKTLAAHPQEVTAPVEGIRRNNELTDPHYNDKRSTPQADFTVDLGNDAAGKMRKFAVPHPARALSELATPVESLAGGGDVTHAFAGPQKIGESHLNPALGTGYDLLSTLLARPQDPDSGAGFRTVFDKLAPAGVQAQQAGKFALGRLSGALPLSIQAQQLPSFLQDLKGGVSPTDALGALGGTLYRTPSAQKEKQLFRLRSRLERHQITYPEYVKRRDALSGFAP